MLLPSAETGSSSSAPVTVKSESSGISNDDMSSSPALMDNSLLDTCGQSLLQPPIDLSAVSFQLMTPQEMQIISQQIQLQMQQTQLQMLQLALRQEQLRAAQMQLQLQQQTQLASQQLTTHQQQAAQPLTVTQQTVLQLASSQQQPNNSVQHLPSPRLPSSRLPSPWPPSSHDVQPISVIQNTTPVTSQTGMSFCSSAASHSSSGSTKDVISSSKSQLAAFCCDSFGPCETSSAKVVGSETASCMTSMSPPSCLEDGGVIASSSAIPLLQPEPKKPLAYPRHSAPVKMEDTTSMNSVSLMRHHNTAKDELRSHPKDSVQHLMAQARNSSSGSGRALGMPSSCHGLQSAIAADLGGLQPNQFQNPPSHAVKSFVSSKFGASQRDHSEHMQDVERFARNFKRRRISLGFTQCDVGMTMGKLYGNDFSQTTISRFEALNLSFKNMCKLKPLLQKWLDDVSAASERSTQVATTSGADANAVAIAESLARRRKKRTNIDHTVRLALEQYFLQNSKPTAEEIAAVADGLQMEKEVIQVWFCNRRQKEKRVHPNTGSTAPCVTG